MREWKRQYGSRESHVLPSSVAPSLGCWVICDLLPLFLAFFVVSKVVFQVLLLKICLHELMHPTSKIRGALVETRLGVESPTIGPISSPKPTAPRSLIQYLLRTLSLLTFMTTVWSLEGVKGRTWRVLNEISPAPVQGSCPHNSHWGENPCRKEKKV